MERRQVLSKISEAQSKALLYDWQFWGRANQQPPEIDGINFDTWLLLAGRGFGKTRTGAEYIKYAVKSGKAKRIALVARTAADVRDVVVEGQSGLLSVFPDGAKPKYEPSKRRLTWPNGAIATTFSAEEPDALRGPQFDCAWGDELGSWKYEEAYDNLLFGLRLGKEPKAIFTTTPKPVKLVKQLLEDDRTFVTRGSTFVNSGNLAPKFLRSIMAKYEGTRLGRQELYAEMLTDTPGALWSLAQLDALRVIKAVPLVRIVVGVDPAITSNESSAETGIIVVGISDKNELFVLDDCTVSGSPATWGNAVVTAYNKWHADKTVVEVNNGGDMCEATIRNVDGGEFLPIQKVRATRGKYLRAEPIAAIAEQKRYHHVGYFGELESQMCSYVPGEKSPDRLDAMVWAATALLGSGSLHEVDNDIMDALFNHTGV